MLVERGQIVSGKLTHLITANIESNCLMDDPGQISNCSYEDIILNLYLPVGLEMDSLVIIITAKVCMQEHLIK